MYGINNIHYDDFGNIVVSLLDIHAPIKQECARAGKAAKQRSRYKNRFNKNKCETNVLNYSEKLKEIFIVK